MGVGSVRRVSEGNVRLWGFQRGCKSKCSGYLLLRWEKRVLLRCALRQLRAVPGPCWGAPGSARAPLGHRVPGEAVLERERVYVIIGSYIMVFSTPL